MHHVEAAGDCTEDVPDKVCIYTLLHRLFTAGTDCLRAAMAFPCEYDFVDNDHKICIGKMSEY